MQEAIAVIAAQMRCPTTGSPPASIARAGPNCGIEATLTMSEAGDGAETWISST
jgi:hypothetical protein